MRSQSAMPSLMAGLQNYWPLHEANGARYSLEGKTLTLTDNNTVTQAAGHVINSAQFTRANSEYLSRASEAALQLGDIYVNWVFWFYQDALGNSEAYISKFGNGAGLNEYIIGKTSTNFLQLVLADGSTIRLNFTTTLSVSTGVWTMVYCYHDPVANEGGCSFNNGAIQTSATSAALGTGTEVMRLGSSVGFGDFLGGRLCEMGRWDGRLLTNTELTWLFNDGRGRTMPFDGRPSPIMSGRGHGQVLPRRNRIAGVIT